MRSRRLRIFTLAALTLIIVGTGLALALGSGKKQAIAVSTKGECSTTLGGSDALTSALSSAAPGSVLCLADGSYAKLTLSASKAAPGVTVRAANPAGATIAGVSLAGSNLTLARFVITDGVQLQPGATRMTIDHNRITGGGQGIEHGPYLDPDQRHQDRRQQARSGPSVRTRSTSTATTTPTATGSGC